MDTAFEQTHRIAKLAMDTLKSMALAATPHNIELWYEHIEGRNPSLSRDIQKCLERHGEITQDQADQLYHRYVVHGDLADDMMSLMTKFESEINQLSSVIESSGAKAESRGETLQSLSSELSETAEGNPAVSAIIENVVSVVKSVREENDKLTARLADSADEISGLRESIENVQKEALTDGLTGLNNRRTFDNAIVNLLKSSKEENEELSLILSDIDFFKKFNDKWGHQTGDQVLKLVADVMNSNIKGQDVLARFGGEEFAILLPGTSTENAALLADRIRRAVETRRLKKRSTGEDLGVVTVSMGVANASATDTVESLIERADKCLYLAKDLGRNQVVTEDHESAPEDLKESGAA